MLERLDYAKITQMFARKAKLPTNSRPHASLTRTEERVDRLQDVVRGHVVVFDQQHGGLSLHPGGLHGGLENRLELPQAEPPRDRRGEQPASLHVRR